MRVHRFFALVVTALALTMTSAHVLEMPQKLALSPELYAAVNGTLYRYFAYVGAVYTVGSVSLVALLAWRARGKPSSVPTMIAAICLGAAFVSWLALVAPVNHAVAVEGPSVWTDLRWRWELGHLVGFVLTLAGFCSLVLSVLIDIPIGPIHVEVTRIVHAPPERLVSLYLDWSHWPELFPESIRDVRLAGRKAEATYLEVDHTTDGTVPNVIRELGPHEVRLEEHKRRYDASFLNRFETVPAGTRYTVVADVQLHGPLRALSSFAVPLVTARIRRYILDPMRRAAESHEAADAATRGARI